MTAPDSKPTYWDYLGLEQLLSLQDGLPDGEEPSADELRTVRTPGMPISEVVSG